jgi:hypothetical protein
MTCVHSIDHNGRPRYSTKTHTANPILQGEKQGSKERGIVIASLRRRRIGLIRNTLIDWIDCVAIISFTGNSDGTLPHISERIPKICGR